MYLNGKKLDLQLQNVINLTNLTTAYVIFMRHCMRHMIKKEFWCSYSDRNDALWTLAKRPHNILQSTLSERNDT